MCDMKLHRSNVCYVLLEFSSFTLCVFSLLSVCEGRSELGLRPAALAFICSRPAHSVINESNGGKLKSKNTELW